MASGRLEDAAVTVRRAAAHTKSIREPDERRRPLREYVPEIGRLAHVEFRGIRRFAETRIRSNEIQLHVLARSR